VCWPARGSETRAGAEPATLAWRLASIARVHRILGFGEAAPVSTEAGMQLSFGMGQRPCRAW
jgi:hypothetical protein